MPTYRRYAFLLIPALAFSAAGVSSPCAAAERVVVSAAASLRDLFTDIGSSYERDHPDVKLVLNFNNSSQLANQIEFGAPVAIFATADPRDIEHLATKGLIAMHATFARNSLVIAVANTATHQIDAIGDLGDKGVRLIMAGKQVPISTYTRQFLEKADGKGSFGEGFSERVRANVVSEEPDVRTLANKIALGEGDAGIIYVTDVTNDMKSKVRTIAIPGDLNVTSEYGVGLLASAADNPASQAFYKYLLSAEAGSYLRKHGFVSP
jgi:molybdate transport system substrate-binding protein